jgi:hypothetical protein
MNVAARKRPTLNFDSDKLRMHGWMMGIVLLIASLLVAIIAVAAMFVAGVPMVAAGIEAHREAQARENEGPTVMSLEGFWKHPQTWERGQQPQFLGFEPIDHDIVIHLDSKSDDNSMTMGEFMKMTSGGDKNKSRDVEKSLEGLTDWRRM